MTNRLPFVQRLIAFYQVLHILSRNPLCCMRAPCPVRSKNGDRVLTHAVTHEQKNRGGNNGEKRIHWWCNSSANPFNTAETVWKTSLSNLHTHEATGSSPIVSTRNHRNRLIPVIFFRNLRLFMALNFRRFIKTHTLTHTGSGKHQTARDRMFPIVWAAFSCASVVTWA